ncbi:MAG: DNA mismatch repair endonuclease MutL, partial [Deltaproteobacteria bacterium]|nr:DNA mismatch repair endonuclease MutL [Deltaproteobacteria bacterium]
MTASKIKILPEQVINQIAAGEVIERPASVVKELVENAIDAGSHRIEVELWDAGKQKILVRDNGSGMTPEEAQLCVERHATSKIKCLDDLFKVKSLGFRGEALPSISSVSKLSLTTKTPNTLEATRLRFEGGKKIKEETLGAPSGTELLVEDLFFNTPARFKFLKSKGTELSHCSEVISQLAMVNPSISFRLTHQDREVFFLPKSFSLLERLLAILKESADTFLPMANQHLEWELEAFCGVPHVTAHSSASCYMFVNGRPVRDRTLLHAMSAAYQTLIPHGHYPKVILFLRTQGGDLDVNVHPTKKEVRFKDTHFIHSFVENSIREVLRPKLQVTSAPSVS